MLHINACPKTGSHSLREAKYFIWFVYACWLLMCKHHIKAVDVVAYHFGQQGL